MNGYICGIKHHEKYHYPYQPNSCPPRCFGGEDLRMVWIIYIKFRKPFSHKEGGFFNLKNR